MLSTLVEQSEVVDQNLKRVRPAGIAGGNGVAGVKKFRVAVAPMWPALMRLIFMSSEEREGADAGKQRRLPRHPKHPRLRALHQSGCRFLLPN